jgi:capsular polysaccharide biosynthesis protein
LNETGSTHIGIAAVAEEIVTIETCAQAAPRFAEGIQRERARNPFLDWESSPAVLRMYTLRDVVLDRATMVLLKDGRVIAETIYEQSPAAVAALQVRPDDLREVEAGPVVATCCDHWDSNYYHWVAHTLPTVHAVLRRHQGGDARLIVPPLSPWQRQTLDLVGAAGVPTIVSDPRLQYRLPVAAYCDFAAGRADFSVSAVSQAAYRRMAEEIALADRPRRRIYIDRGQAANRRVPNEAALAERLRRRGFHAVRAETLDEAQKIALFKGAGMVVGQHGAGLANIAFCQPGTVVYELVPEHHLNPCFVVMAMQGGLQHWGDVFPTAVQGGDHTAAWRVDIDIEHVMRRIDELDRLIPPNRRWD